MSEQNSTLQLRHFAKEKLANHLAISPEDISPFIKPDVRHVDADLLHDGKVYDIKTSNPVFTQKEKKAPVWDFDLRGSAWKDGRNHKIKKSSPTCDFYILIGMIENNPERIFLLPSSPAPSSHIRIALKGESKYNQFLI